MIFRGFFSIFRHFFIIFFRVEQTRFSLRSNLEEFPNQIMRHFCKDFQT